MLTSIQLFQLLKNKLCEREVEALVDFMETKHRETSDANSKILATKEDMGGIKIELGRLETKIAENKTDIIRWVFALFIPLMLAIIGLYFKH
jgi:hypothetical protein